jgi:hypothetical protein
LAKTRRRCRSHFHAPASQARRKAPRGRCRWHAMRFALRCRGPDPPHRDRATRGSDPICAAFVETYGASLRNHAIWAHRVNVALRGSATVVTTSRRRSPGKPNGAWSEWSSSSKPCVLVDRFGCSVPPRTGDRGRAAVRRCGRHPGIDPARCGRRPRARTAEGHRRRRSTHWLALRHLDPSAHRLHRRHPNLRPRAGRRNQAAPPHRGIDRADHC